jgi:hypothetical protein
MVDSHGAMPSWLKAKERNTARAHSDGEVVKESDGPDVPEPTNALFLPTTGLPYESPNLAWSTDDHIDEPQPFEIVEPEPLEQRKRRRFDWHGWTGAVLLTIAAVIALMLALNSLVNHMRRVRVDPPRETTQQTPAWREPPWGPVLPSTSSPWVPVLPSADPPAHVPPSLLPLPGAPSPQPVPSNTP